MPLRILFIEDDRPLREALCELIRAWAGEGMQCIEVDRIEEALPLIRQGAIDIIVLDWRISLLPGIDVIAHLKEAMPQDQPAMPIEIISGDISDAEGLAAIQAGADDYAQKGAELRGRFLRMVQKSWARCQQQREAYRLLQWFERHATRGDDAAE